MCSPSLWQLRRSFRVYQAYCNIVSKWSEMVTVWIRSFRCAVCQQSTTLNIDLHPLPNCKDIALKMHRCKCQRHSTLVYKTAQADLKRPEGGHSLAARDMRLCLSLFPPAFSEMSLFFSILSLLHMHIPSLLDSYRLLPI